MTNRKGFTLIEVLASVTILAIVVLAAVFALQQTSVFSKVNHAKETNIQVARTVMEEIKANLKKTDPVQVQLFGQTIALTSLKGTSAVSLPVFYTTDQTVKIEVNGTKPAQSVTVKGTEYPIGDYFRLIQVTCTQVQTGKIYTLKAYVECK
ncbi:type II secretion system protein [Gorillibacterium sp. sgz500922]|uniref:type II secretion system protein n=1 Tax=Gorillibacterium sp. sgz500922 TaxID=3446694 RepID=UPI003F67D4C8